MSIKLNGGGTLPNKLLQSKEYGFIGTDEGVVYRFGNKEIKVEFRDDIEAFDKRIVYVGKNRTSFVFPCKENKKYKISIVSTNIPDNMRRFRVSITNKYPSSSTEALKYYEYGNTTQEKIIETNVVGAEYITVTLGNITDKTTKIKVKEI